MDTDFRTSLVSNLTRPTAIALYHIDDLSGRYSVCFFACWVFRLAVFGDFLLYSDWHTNSINMIDMDTDYRTSLVSNLTRPTAIALYHPDDLSGRYTVCFFACWVFGMAVFGDFLLYSDWDTNSINMIDMDTDYRTSLVSNLTRVTAIALYHPDDLSGRYSVCFFACWVLGLAVFGDFLLYSDWDTNSINMTDMDTDFRTSLVSNLTRPTAIALFHPDDLSGR